MRFLYPEKWHVGGRHKQEMKQRVLFALLQESMRERRIILWSPSQHRDTLGKTSANGTMHLSGMCSVAGEVGFLKFTCWRSSVTPTEILATPLAESNARLWDSRGNAKGQEESRRPNAKGQRYEVPRPISKSVSNKHRKVYAGWTNRPTKLSSEMDQSVWNSLWERSESGAKKTEFSTSGQLNFTLDKMKLLASSPYRTQKLIPEGLETQMRKVK